MVLFSQLDFDNPEARAERAGTPVRNPAEKLRIE
jgi:hypothetical protein